MFVTMATVIALYMSYSIIYSRSHFLMSSRFSAGWGVGGGEGNGGSDGAMVLLKSVLLIWVIVGQRVYYACSRCGWGCLDICSLVYHFSFLSLSLWETPSYRLKYCLKRAVKPKTTN